MAKSRNSEI